MKVAILTGGGDVPGLNSAIQGLTLGAQKRGWQVLGLQRGWAALLQLDANDADSLRRHTCVLDGQAVRGIDRLGGTMLHSSRTNPGNVARDAVPKGLVAVAKANGRFDCTARVLHNLKALHIDVLVAIGGDDTLSYAEHLAQQGVDVLGIPKTMDNDVFGTDYCLGFATCVSRSVEYLHQLRSCSASHERFAVVEVMGRNSGASCLMPSYLAGVDRALVAEVPFSSSLLAEKLLRDRADNPDGYAMVTVSEGARFVDGDISESGPEDAYGHRKLGGIGQQLGHALQAATGVGIIAQSLAYLVRCGRPDPLDVMVTFNFAALAIELIAKREFRRLVRLHQGVYGHAPLRIVSEGKKTLDVQRFYDAEEYRPRVQQVAGVGMYLY